MSQSSLAACDLVWAPMSFDDLDWVLEAEQQLHPFPWTRKNFEDSLFAGYSCWVMRLDGELAGYAVMMSVLDEAHLLNISVAQAVQGRGLGALLLDHLCDAARRAGAIQMLLEVRPSNQAAHRLYLKAGFELLSVRKGYYRAHEGREDALVMQRKLA